MMRVPRRRLFLPCEACAGPLLRPCEVSAVCVVAFIFQPIFLGPRSLSCLRPSLCTLSLPLIRFILPILQQPCFALTAAHFNRSESLSAFSPSLRLPLGRLLRGLKLDELRRRLLRVPRQVLARRIVLVPARH
jgi:hypothetical protein